MQRVRVGMTGLASIILLIGLGSAVYSSANKEAAVSAVGASKADVVANMTGEGNVAAEKTEEPLAELGLAPGKALTNTSAPAK